MIRGLLENTYFDFSQLIDVSYYNTIFSSVNFPDVECHHIVMDEITLHDTDLSPFGDEVTVYGGFDEPKEKEFAVHLLMNTKGEATVTLVEEV